MKDVSNTFSVVYALDFNYVSFLKVSLKSLEYHYKSKKKLDIYIIDLGLFEYHKKEIVNIIKNENIQIHWVTPDISEIAKKIPSDKSIYETSVYYWLFLSLYLPEQLDKVVMIDCDTIIKTDISKLGETDLRDFGFFAVVDSLRPCFQDGGVNNYRDLNIDGNTAYFNSGVLVLSMSYWNKNNLTDKFSKCIIEHKENLLLLPDQYPFNVVLYNKIGQLDPRWNKYAFDDNIEEAFIIHYAGEKSVHYLNQFKNEFRFFEQLNSTDDFIKKATFWNEGFSDDFPEMLSSFKDNSNEIEYSFIEGKLSDIIYKKIQQKCELFNVTLEEFFLGIYLLSAHQFTVNSSNVVVGKVIKELDRVDSNYTPLWIKIDPFIYGDDLKTFFEQMKYYLVKLHNNWMPYGQITSSFLENSYNKNSGFDFVYLYNLDEYDESKSLHELVTPTDNKYPIKIKTGLMIEDKEGQLNWKVYYRSIGTYSNDMLKLSMTYTSLIKKIVDDDLSDLSSLKKLMLTDSIKLYEKINKTDKEIDFSRLLDPFDSFASKFPENIAFVQGKTKVTYGELKYKSDLLATILQKKNICPENVIGLAISRNVNVVIGLLGVIKSGAAFCFLDQSLPKDRLDYMVSLTELKIIIVDNDTEIKCECDHIINLSEDLIGVNDVDICDADFKNDRLSYVIFTSGTTGLPKGVQIENKQVVNLLFSMMEKIEIKNKDKFLAVTSFTFDISILEIL
ncbi:MAG: AMP-binding protein, partial [Bdellovibrionales bacterium]|nr:AMP-binding protein [Bdellovibrionales bacterium]